MAAAAIVYAYASVVSSITRVKSPGKPGFPCVFAGFAEHCAELQNRIDFMRCHRILWRHSMELINRRCFELKHELNGVSYAADVSAPRKV